MHRTRCETNGGWRMVTRCLKPRGTTSRLSELGCQIPPQSQSVWHQMGHVWDFLRSDFSTFWLEELNLAKMYSNLIFKKSRICPIWLQSADCGPKPGCVSGWPDLDPKWVKLTPEPNQNFLNLIWKNLQICPIWGQSDPLWVQIWSSYVWERDVIFKTWRWRRLESRTHHCVLRSG